MCSGRRKPMNTRNTLALLRRLRRAGGEFVLCPGHGMIILKVMPDGIPQIQPVHIQGMTVAYIWPTRGCHYLSGNHFGYTSSALARTIAILTGSELVRFTDLLERPKNLDNRETAKLHALMDRLGTTPAL